ncbi:MAG TPA: hypothetical protein DDW27_00995 [Bacteroidales bacterium]|nr:hypothetical protein [Bacteroidales bacterium]
MPEKYNRKQITCVFGAIYPHVTGGAEIFNYFLLKEISKNNKIILISENDPDIEGVVFRKLRKREPVRLFYPFQLFILLCKYSRKSDSIYTSFMRAPWFIFFPLTLFSILRKVPYSFTIHGGGMMKWKFKLPFNIFFKRAKAITGVSHRICEEYKNRTGLNIRYLPPLIPFLSTKLSREALRIKYNLPVDTNVILFVGSLKPLKNPVNILKALFLIGKDFIEEHRIRLIYAGDGILKKEINDNAIRGNISDFVSIPGYVPLESIHEMYSLADLYVICSDFEGTPIALLEAMFNSLPIVASDAPGINNFLVNNETAILYKTDDIDMLAEGVKMLLTNPAKRNYIRKNAKMYYDEHFDYHSIANEYTDLIVS